MPSNSSTPCKNITPRINRNATTNKPILILPDKLTMVENRRGPTKAVAFPEKAKKPLFQNEAIFDLWCARHI